MSSHQIQITKTNYMKYGECHVKLNGADVFFPAPAFFWQFAQ